MLEHAGRCAAHAALDPVRAVHEFRKSIRRTRSLLRLLERMLPRKVYRKARSALRDIHRATSDLRDRDVVLSTLESLPRDDSLDDALIASAATHIAAAEPVSHERSRAVLADLARRLPAISKRVANALPRKIRKRDMRRAIARSYRRTRARLRAWRRSGKEEDLHDWRKRTKELRYQVELFIDDAPEREARRLTSRFSRLTTHLGKLVDLMVLREYVEAHLPAEYQRVLIGSIDRQFARLQEKTLRKGRDLFSRPPERFARRLMRMNRRKRS